MIEEDFIARQALVDYIEKYKQREKAEDIDALAEAGDEISWLAAKLNSHLAHGIATDQASVAARKTIYGTNQKKVKHPPGIFKLFCQALEDFILRILLVAAALSIALQTATEADHRDTAWIEGFAIFIAVMVCATVTAVNDYQKERQFIQLNAVADQKKRVTVWRDSKQVSIHQDFLLVGDIIDIHEGMDLPADGLMFQSNQITTDESAMTGQTEPINKNTLQRCLRKKREIGTQSQDCKHEIPSPVMMSGTKVLTGEGKMLVVVVGDQSCVGKIRAMASQDDDIDTPLQEKLQKVATDIGKFGLYAAIFIVVVLLIRFAIVKGLAQDPKDKWDTGPDLVRMLGFIILGITVIVVAIPEGLPLAVTLSLAFSVKKMLKDNNLVRKMEACETMGGANNICSDKTGTLTMNQMTINDIWNQSVTKVDVNKEIFTSEEYFPNKEYFQLFKVASLVNSAAILQPAIKGSPTEISFLRFFRKMGVEYNTERSLYKIELKYPFSSARKRMSVITDFNGHKCLFIKGASEIILQSCVDWFNSSTGRVEPLGDLKHYINDSVIKQMAENTLRTLCLAYKPIMPRDSYEQKDQIGVYEIQKKNLILIAVVGVRDIPRPEVPSAIEICHQAGIIVRMVTGDNLITARAIAKQIGIFRINSEGIAMQGPEFTRLVGGVVCAKCKTARCDCPTDPEQAEKQKKEVRVDTIAKGEQFDKIKDKLLILARSRPQDKYCLVTALRERGNVVAVTGDGTNDAPALRKADVGFAMGISGTQVARESAAIILMDDNFNSIVKAVLWGRNIYDSIRKFIQFQLTVNVVAVVITLVGAALIQKEVLKPIQMLWVNLIMDTLASLALATEEPNPELLKRKPHNRDDYIVNRVMLKHIIGQAIFQLVVMMVVVFMGEQFIPEYVDGHDFVTDPKDPYYQHPEFKWKDGVVGGNICSGRFYFINGQEDYAAAFKKTNNYSRHFTIVFNVFVMMQIFNFLNARKLHEQLNIFAGIFDSFIFTVIVLSILGVQIILVTFASFAFGLYDRGLTIQHWLICVGFGAISLIVNFLLKFIPVGKAKVEDVSKVGSFGNRINTDEDSNHSVPIANEDHKLTAEKLNYEVKVHGSSDLFLANEPSLSLT